MTIERELLQRAKILLDCVCTSPVQKEIEELLAQPEQEPVGIVRTIGGYPDDSEHVVDWLCKYKDLKEGDRLYLAPPTREPLSDDVIRNFADAFGYMVHNNAFTQGVRWAEKQHKIGVEQ